MKFKSLALVVIGLTLATSSLTTPILAQQTTTSTPNSEQTEPTSTTQDVVSPDIDDSDNESDVDESDTGPVLEDDGSSETVDLEDNEAANSKALKSGQPQMLAQAPKVGRFQAMLLAKTQIGTRERLVNCNKYSPYFGKGCQAWCADFVSWSFDQVGNKNKRLPWKNPSTVISILTWARRANQLVDKPEPGDLFVAQGKGRSHVGFVRTVQGNRFRTVEGNKDNMVKSVWRPIKRPADGGFYFVRVPARLRT